MTDSSFSDLKFTFVTSSPTLGTFDFMISKSLLTISTDITISKKLNEINSNWIFNSSDVITELAYIDAATFAIVMM